MKIDKLMMGQRIRTEREALGYTRDQFAEMLGVTPKFCSDIELGVKGVSMETLANISELFAIPTDYILFGTQGQYVDTLSGLLLRVTPAEKQFIEDFTRLLIGNRDKFQINAK